MCSVSMNFCMAHHVSSILRVFLFSRKVLEEVSVHHPSVNNNVGLGEWECWKIWNDHVMSLCPLVQRDLRYIVKLHKMTSHGRDFMWPW